MIKSLPFNYNENIKCISEKQFSVHLDLYHGYVDKTNEITKVLSEKSLEEKANSIYSSYRGAKASETYALDGVILHELYFQNIGGTDNAPLSDIKDLIAQSFGNFSNWENDFKACAKAARGWCVFLFEQRTESFRNILQDTHNEGVIAGSFPLLVLDVYEHAYFIDYANKKDAYIDAFMKNINWGVVGRRLGRMQN